MLWGNSRSLQRDPVAVAIVVGFTWGWPQNWFVVWSVRPLTNGAQVRPDSVDVQLGTPGFTYSLTVTNTGTQTATFEARYGFVVF
jgi:hypothetical protein